MTERWKAWKSKKQDFPSSHRSLEISQKRRDSHIPTAPATRLWKSGKPKTGFPLSHSHLSQIETKQPTVSTIAYESAALPTELRRRSSRINFLAELANRGAQLLGGRSLTHAFILRFRFRRQQDPQSHRATTLPRRHPGAVKWLYSMNT